MKEEKPIFKCIKATSWYSNNWVDPKVKVDTNEISGRHYIDDKMAWLEEDMERKTDEANKIIRKLKERGDK